MARQAGWGEAGWGVRSTALVEEGQAVVELVGTFISETAHLILPDKRFVVALTEPTQRAAAHEALTWSAAITNTARPAQLRGAGAH